MATSTGLDADLALITACRDALGAATPGPWKADTRERGDCVVWGAGTDVFVANVQSDPHWTHNRAPAFDVDKADARVIAGAVNSLPAALSLIEDTLNRHAPTDRYSHDADTGPHCAECSRNSGGRVITDDHPCPTYNGALAALHTIAVALGIDPE